MSPATAFGDANAATTSSCNSPLVEMHVAGVDATRRHAGRCTGRRPPRPPRMTAAMSHTASPPTSTAMSIDPSATSMWAQKSPNPRTASSGAPARGTRASSPTDSNASTESYARWASSMRATFDTADRLRRRAARQRRARPTTATRAPAPTPRRRPARRRPRARERRPHRDAAGVALRAVDRVDDPAPAAAPLAGGAELLAQDRVAGARRGEAAPGSSPPPPGRPRSPA